VRGQVSRKLNLFAVGPDTRTLYLHQGGPVWDPTFLTAVAGSSPLLQVLALRAAGELVGFLLHGFGQYSPGKLDANVLKADLADFLAHLAPSWGREGGGTMLQ
jgi:hypothetical protein